MCHEPCAIHELFIIVTLDSNHKIVILTVSMKTVWYCMFGKVKIKEGDPRYIVGYLWNIHVIRSDTCSHLMCKLIPLKSPSTIEGTVIRSLPSVK